MIEKPYLLIDAGGTTVFPNPDILTHFAQIHEINLTDKMLYEGYYKLIYLLEAHNNFPRNPWPNGYTFALLETLGLSTQNTKKMAEAVNKYHEQTSLWTFTYPWVYGALASLQENGYRMSILSNSDGRTKQIFDELKLSQFFEHIYDSKYLNYEKPDPRIFDIVLSQLRIQPKDILYIGDIFSVDVLGSNQAEIGGLHLDPLGLYRNRQGVHLDNITCLESWLSTYEKHPTNFTSNLFPFSNMGGINSLSRVNQVFPQKHFEKIVT